MTTLKGYQARPDRFSANGELKLCSGFMHKYEPVWLPLIRFHTLKNGNPMSECVECWRARVGLDPAQKRIRNEEWLPVLVRLVEILGSKAEVARRLNRSKAMFSRPRDRMGADLFREMEQLVYELEKIRKPGGGRSGEAQVVSSSQIGPLIAEFRKEWEIERPPLINGRYGQKERDFITGLQYLEMKTGIHERRITAFQHQQIPYVPLSQADALLVAMGKWELLDTEEIEVKPNPVWTMHSYLDYMRNKGCI